MADSEDLINRVHKVLTALDGVNHADAMRVLRAAQVMVAEDLEPHIQVVIDRESIQ